MITEYALATCENCGRQENALGESTGRWKLPAGWIYVGVATAANGIQRDMYIQHTWAICSKACMRAKLHNHAEAML